MARDADLPYVRPLADRLHELRHSWLLVLQLCLSTGIAWVVAHDLVGHAQPFFAPIAAAISITVGFGKRRSVVVELVIGVSIGILVGELLVLGIGRGGWQVAIVVALAVSVSIVLGVGRLARTQSATSAILIATVTPLVPDAHPALDRFVDALIGGLAGLLIALLIPADPVRMIGGQVRSVLAELATMVTNVATSLRWTDPGPAWTALQQGRALQPRIEVLTATAESASEVSRLSPLRWDDRSHVQLYAGTVRWIDNAVRDARVLARRVETLTRRQVPTPAGLAAVMSDLARAVDVFGEALDDQGRFDDVRDLLIEVARSATATLGPSEPLSVVSTVAQLRALCADLLYAIGLKPVQVDGLFEPDEST